MNDTAFMRAAFCLPVGLPAILCAAVGADSPVALKVSAVFVGYPVVFYGPPYAAFVATALWLLRREPASAHLEFALLSPLLFGAVLVVWSTGLSFWMWRTRFELGTSPGDLTSQLLGAQVWMPIALIYGYAYVAVALAVRAAARSVRFIAP